MIGYVMKVTSAVGFGSRVSVLQENRNGRWHSLDIPEAVRLQARPRSSVGPERWSYEPQVAGSSPAGTSFSFLHFYLPLHDLDDALATGIYISFLSECSARIMRARVSCCTDVTVSISLLGLRVMSHVAKCISSFKALCGSEWIHVIIQ